MQTMVITEPYHRVHVKLALDAQGSCVVWSALCYIARLKQLGFAVRFPALIHPRESCGPVQCYTRAKLAALAVADYLEEVRRLGNPGPSS